MKIKLISCMVAVMALTGCASIGPKVARQAQYPYNEAIVASWKEQLLLNLVRLRYRDDPYFIEVGSITSSHTFGLGLNGTSKFPGINCNWANSITPGVEYKEQPTITYVPLQGEDYVKKLLGNIPLSKVLALSHSGWSVERVFNVCVKEMNGLNNAPSASGPTPDYIPEYLEFNHLMRNLRTLQKAHLLLFDTDPEHDILAPEALVDPDKDLYMAITPDERYASTIDEVYNMLNLDAELERYKFSGNLLKPNEPNKVKIKTRTFLGTLYYLSQSVIVPKKHVNSGLVTVTKDDSGKPFDWQEVSGTAMVICSSKSKPSCAAVKVCYRGYWFYIDDRDLNSKSTFMLLSNLFNLQSSSSGNNMPRLTIPLR